MAARRYLVIYHDGNQLRAATVETEDPPEAITPAHVHPNCEAVNAIVAVPTEPLHSEPWQRDVKLELWLDNSNGPRRTHPSPIDLGELSTDPAWEEFIRLGRELGDSFDPDRLAAEYDPPPGDPEAYDAAMDAAYGTGTDPAAVAEAIRAEPR